MLQPAARYTAEMQTECTVVDALFNAIIHCWHTGIHGRMLWKIVILGQVLLVLVFSVNATQTYWKNISDDDQCRCLGYKPEMKTVVLVFTL